MHYYFIGIKGTGMASLAIMLNDLGYEVSGSDLDKHFFTEEGLKDRSIPILPFDENNIQDGYTVIIGNAFLEDFPEVIAARKNPTCTCYRYHEFVGFFLKDYETIAISGSHGKTTTTGLMKSMLKNRDCGYLIGDGEGHIAEDTKLFALEADEFRRHFLAYHPEYAIMTNIDIDHVDYFKDEADYRSAYEEFSNQVSKAIFIYGEDEQAHLLNLNHNIPHYWYGTKDTDDLQAVNIVETNELMEFDVRFLGKDCGHFVLPLVGHHLLLNSLACIGIGIQLGLSNKEMEEGLSSFKGVRRRFVVEKDEHNIYIDDYAHHPTEVSVTIDAARKRFPDQKLVAVFKPHRASRVLYFADDFAKALEKADKVYLCDFTSIDDKQDGTDIDITYLQKKIPGSVVLEENENGARILAKEKDACFLFMSSKDIYWLSKMLQGIPKPE